VTELYAPIRYDQKVAWRGVGLRLQAFIVVSFTSSQLTPGVMV